MSIRFDFVIFFEIGSCKAELSSYNSQPCKAGDLQPNAIVV
jgi:hypothetical protein